MLIIFVAIILSTRLGKLKAGALLKGGIVLGGAALITGAVLAAKSSDGDFDQDRERTDEEKEADIEKIISACAPQDKHSIYVIINAVRVVCALWYCG